MQRKSCVCADLAPLRLFQRSQRLAKVCPRSPRPFFGSEKALNLVTKLLIWQHCMHLYSTLCLTVATHTFSNLHTHTGISGPRPIRGGVCPSLSLIGLDHDMSLMCVCCWTTGRLSESRILFFFSRTAGHVRPQIFFSRTIEKLGRTLEPCIFIICIESIHETRVYYIYHR